jgi:hypothetical protein
MKYRMKLIGDVTIQAQEDVERGSEQKGIGNVLFTPSPSLWLGCGSGQQYARVHVVHAVVASGLMSSP